MPFLGSIFQRLRSESAVLDTEAKDEHKLKKRSLLFSSHTISPRRSGVDSTPLFSTPTPPAASRFSTTAVPDQPCLPIYESFTTGKHRSMFLENWQLQYIQKPNARRLSRIAIIGDFQNLERRNSQPVSEHTSLSTAAEKPPGHGQTPELGRYYRSLLPDTRTMWDEDDDENAGGQPVEGQQEQQDTEPGTDSTTTADSSPRSLVPQEETAEDSMPQEETVEDSMPREEDTVEGSVLQEDPAEKGMRRTSPAESRGPSSEATRATRAGSCASFASTEVEFGEEACVFSWERAGPARCVRVRSDDGWPLWPGTAPAAGSSVGATAVGPATGPVVGPWVVRSLGPAVGPFPWSPAASTAGSDDSGVAPPPTPPPKSAKRLSRAVGKRQTGQSLAGRVDDAGAGSVGLQICSELLTDQLTKAVVSSGQKDSDKTEEKRQVNKKLQVLLMIEAYEGMLRSVRVAGGGVEDESGSASASGSGGSAAGREGEEKRKTMVQMVPVLEHWLDALHAVYDEALQGDDGDE